MVQKETVVFVNVPLKASLLCKYLCCTIYVMQSFPLNKTISLFLHLCFLDHTFQVADHQTSPNLLLVVHWDVCLYCWFFDMVINNPLSTAIFSFWWSVIDVKSKTLTIPALGDSSLLLYQRSKYHTTNHPIIQHR
jgi:hypothetical protein